MKKITLTALLLSFFCCKTFAQPPVTGGLNLWLEASTGFHDNGPGAPATWVDQSGAGNDIDAAAQASEPVFTPNAAGSGYAGIFFNGTNNYMFRPASATNGFTGTGATLFVVRIGNTIDNTNPPLFRTTLSIGENNTFDNEFCLMCNWAIHTTSSGNWFRQDHQCYAKLPNDKPVVLSGVINSGLTSSDISYYVNGVASVNAPVTQGSPSALTSATRSIIVGGRYDGSGTPTLQTDTWFSGYILEVLAYDTILSPAAVDSVNNYLKCKYNVNYAGCNSPLTCISRKDADNTTGVETLTADASKLYQNTPNPFNGETNIPYYVAGMKQSAAIVLYDINGKVLSRYPITENGKGAITIHAANMIPGVYLYSLVIDGRETDSKRMILAR